MLYPKPKGDKCVKCFVILCESVRELLAQQSCGLLNNISFNKNFAVLQMQKKKKKID